MELPEDQTIAIAPMRQWTSERMKALREAAGFSQAELASRMSVHFSRVSDFENNRSDYKASTVFRYAKCLGVSMEKVFTGAPAWRRGAKQGAVVILSEDEVVKRLMAIGYSREDSEEAARHLLS